MTVLRSQRLLLRPATMDDVDAFCDILSDARAMRFWSTPPHASKVETIKWVANMVAMKDEGTDFVWEYRGRVIGKGGAYAMPEVGFILHPEFWGKGFAREAMEAIIPYLFALTDTPALTADVDPDNAASISLLASLGFKETHRAKNTFCINGVWVHSVYFALPRG